MHRRGLTAGAFAAFLALGFAAHAGGPSSRTYAKDTQGIFWFMHISDLHIETNEITGVSMQTLQYTLTDVVDVIQPALVFASGDLADGSLYGVPTSGQDQGEWDLYKQAYTEAGMTSSFYFDMPGNHDSYGDQGLTYFIANSLQGQATNGRLFADTTYKTPLGEYYFVALNSAGLYGTLMSYGDPEFTNVSDLADGLNAHKDAQLTFAFAHHHLTPHGDIAVQVGSLGTDDPPVNAAQVSTMLQGAGAFYMHGHVHQYKESFEGNVVVHQIGKLAANGGVDRSTAQTYADTMYLSNIGVGIVDHNAFIYRATGSDDPWPLVAITAPVDFYLKGGGKPAGSTAGVSYEGDFEAYQTHKNPYSYDVCKDSKTNPIRALALAKDKITSVSALLDGSAVAQLKPVATPKGIFAGEMDTTGLTAGLHHLTVVATVGTVAREDSIWVNFTDGPCEPQVDAGPDGAAGSSGAGGSAGSAAGGSGAAAPDGGGLGAPCLESSDCAAGFACGGLNCVPACGPQTPCPAGYSCDPAAWVCLQQGAPADADAGSTGGCTTGAAQRPQSAGAMLLALLALGIQRRRHIKPRGSYRAV